MLLSLMTPKLRGGCDVVTRRGAVGDLHGDRISALASHLRGTDDTGRGVQTHPFRQADGGNHRPDIRGSTAGGASVVL